MTWHRKDLLDLQSLSAEEIRTVLDTAREFKAVGKRPIKKLPTLRGKTVVNLFVEPSTRTRISFELAAQRLSADVINFTAEASSLRKGETLKDTARNLEALRVDTIIIRHSAAGAPHFLARVLEAHVVNAGDGAHEHPTQGLLDLFTMREKFGRIAGLKVTIVGDILYSRVARSNIHLLSKFGVDIVLCGPAPLLPPEMARIAPGVTLTHNIGEAIRGADVIMMLRVQLERQHEAAFPAGEYFQFYGLRLEHLELAKPGAIVMHPGPINRGREIASEVADSQVSVILNQVENGVAVRMAVLERVLG